VQGAALQRMLQLTRSTHRRSCPANSFAYRCLSCAPTGPFCLGEIRLTLEDRLIERYQQRDRTVTKATMKRCSVLTIACQQ
jgi:hypothetical protein